MRRGIGGVRLVFKSRGGKKEMRSDMRGTEDGRYRCDGVTDRE
jgi:hypothetical protein